MSRKFLIIALVAGLGLFVTLQLTASSEDFTGHPAPEVGQAAPAFTLMDVNGNEHSLADYAGKTVILEWYNPGCPYVKMHYKTGNIPGLQETYTEKDVVWLSIMTNPPSSEKLAGLNKEFGSLADAVLLDKDGSVGRAYNARTTPEMFLIDGEGVLQYMGAIDDHYSSSESGLEDATTHISVAAEALLAGETIETTKTRPYGCSVKYP